VHYHCPYCARKPENQALCRQEEEIKAKEEAKRRAEERMVQEKEDRGKADNVAGAAYEFWTLLGEVTEEFYHDQNVEIPIPSPDSITVTMEFGVSEEASNITAITAGHAPPVVTEQDVQHEEEEEVQVQEHIPVQDTTAPEIEAPPPVPLHLTLLELVTAAGTAPDADSTAEVDEEGSEDVGDSDEDDDEPVAEEVEADDANLDDWDSDTERALAELLDEEFFA
jgi:hypothetical protein